VWDNIMLALEVRGWRTPRRGRGGLELLGIQHLSQRRVATLSGGQLRLASLTAAIAHGRPLLLLDEPTTYLDEEKAEEVACILAGLRGANGCTSIVVATHDPRLVRVADAAYTIHEGRVRPGPPRGG
jgi:ABC-type lipoprotein export system ATPase subunit